MDTLPVGTPDAEETAPLIRAREAQMALSAAFVALTTAVLHAEAVAMAVARALDALAERAP